MLQSGVKEFEKGRTFTKPFR